MNSFHWLRAFLILLATCAAVVILSSPAFADSHKGKHGMHGKHHQCPAYSELDANSDGSVTADEFNAFRAERMAARAAAGGEMKNAKNAPTFEDLDLDNDGNLSAEEFAEHHSQCPMNKNRKEAAATE